MEAIGFDEDSTVVGRSVPINPERSGALPGSPGSCGDANTTASSDLENGEAHFEGNELREEERL